MRVYDLWLPIVLSGLATHIMSTLAWMVLPHHKPEWKGLPAENEVIDLLRQRGVGPGQYVFPHTRDPKVMASEEFQRKQGKCRGTLILWSTPPNMGQAIGLTLAFFFLAAFSIGYLATLGVAAGAPFMKVFQFVATAGILAHCYGEFPGVFWFRRKVAMDLVDKLAYALVTGLIFAALWPRA